MAAPITFDDAFAKSTAPTGQRQGGNINLHNRPKVANPDGSYSTVRSMSIGTDQGEVLIPTVSDHGRLMSDAEAEQQYRSTGRHLGIFDSPQSATRYAESLHNDQAREYGGKSAPITFDDAMRTRAAASSTTVDTGRLQKAQQLRDMGLTDPRDLSNPDVPIEGFMRHQAPPIGDAPAANFGQALRTSIIADPATQSRNAAESLFPGDPSGPSRVGMVDGQQVYTDNQGQLRRVSGPWSRRFAQFIANMPEMVGGTAAGVATANPIAGSALGAAGARGIKRGLSELAYGEPATPSSVAREMGTEAVTDAAGGLIGKGITKFADRGRVVDFSPQNMRTAEDVISRLKQSTGIDLDLAQASGNRKLIDLRAYAARFPGRSAELVQAAEEIQRGQVDTAVNRVMDSIARAAPAEVYGVRGRNAAQLVIDTAREARNNAARPYFDAARDVTLGGDVVSTLSSDPVLSSFAAKVKRSPLYRRDLGLPAKDSTSIPGSERTNLVMSDAPGRREGQLLDWQTTRTPAVTVNGSTPAGTVGFWHAVRQEIDDAISSSEGNRNKARILTKARDDLTQKLEAASPEFAEANRFWAKETAEKIEPLEQGTIGVLARIKEPKAATAAARIFADPNISAAEIRATRASIASKDSDAWNGLVRQYIAGKWNRALKETQTGAEVNAAGKLRQGLIGTPADKEKLQAMLPPGSLEAFDSLMEGLQAVSRTPSAGSNTMRDSQVRDMLKGQGAVAFKWLTQFRSQLTNAAEQRSLERGTEAITEAILDPAKRAQLRQVAKMSEPNRRAIVLANVLGAQLIKTAAQAGGPEQMPEAYGADPLRFPERVTPMRSPASSSRTALEPVTNLGALRTTPLPHRQR